MALSQKHRTTLFAKLSPIVGDEEAEALLSEYPTRAADEPVTRETFELRMSDFEVRMAQIDARFAQVDARFAQVDARFAEMEMRLTEKLRQQTVWMVTALVGGLTVGMGLASAVATALGG